MRKAALIWIGLIGGATSAAVADTSQDCAQNRDRDLIILACSEIIGHGGNVAWAYYNRGNAHRAKGENDRAIADYTMAIEINPKHANAFNNRGNAYAALGKRGEAIADCRRALAIDRDIQESKDTLKRLGASQ